MGRISQKALMRLEEWYESPRFKLAGWEPDFLKQLDQWLSANRSNINRAEAVALYRAYRFRQYKIPLLSRHSPYG